MNPIYNNTKLRLVGMASGLDTDTIVQQLMFIEKQPLYKLQRQKQLMEWRMEAYREITNALRSFKEQFFDITKRTSYLLSETAFKTFKVSSSADEYVTARGTASAQVGSHKVFVEQLATAAKAEGEKGISNPITSGEITDFNLKDKAITVTLDGVTKKIYLDDYEDVEDLQTKLQNKLDEAFGGGKINITIEDGGRIQFTTGEGVTKLTFVSGDALSDLGISPGTSNRISTSSTLAELKNKLKNELKFDADGNVSFTINGKTFTFSENDTLKNIISTINNDKDINVTISYDEVEDRFTITSKQTGAGKNISFADSEDSSFLAALGLSESNISDGQDAVVYIDNVKIVRSSNTFTVNGIEYTIRKPHPNESSAATITVEQDIDTVFNAIKSFVDEYNKLIDMLNLKLSEKYDRNYQPLTDDEKEEMTEDEIKKWEAKAKTGLLRNDSILQQIQQKMRTALMDAVEGVGLNLAAIGISSTSYRDNGRLTINEDKLRKALTENPDEVMGLFIKTSDTVPSYDRDLSAEERKTRYKEAGVLHRISDILNDYISTVRDKNGYKGILLERAGMEGDMSQFENSLSKEIKSFEERISELYVKLYEKEEKYYRQYTVLEKYMNQMNSQLNWLLSQLGASGR